MDAAKAILNKFIPMQAHSETKKNLKTAQHAIYKKQKKKDKAQSHQKEGEGEEEIETKETNKKQNKKHNRKCQ